MDIVVCTYICIQAYIHKQLYDVMRIIMYSGDGYVNIDNIAPVVPNVVNNDDDNNVVNNDDESDVANNDDESDVANDDDNDENNGPNNVCDLEVHILEPHVGLPSNSSRESGSSGDANVRSDMSSERLSSYDGDSPESSASTCGSKVNIHNI